MPGVGVLGGGDSWSWRRRPMRVLLVEDDNMIGDSIRQGLQHDGYTVDWVHDGHAAELAVRTHDYAVMLLDLGLPKKSGFDVLTTLRRLGKALPVVILTARDAVADRVRGLDSGADDYLVKPFALDELAARLRAVLRRQSGRADPVVTYGGLTLNPATYQVTWQGQPVGVSGRGV